MIGCAEYIWLDGSSPTKQLRSKIRVLDFDSDEPTLSSFPVWNYDGSSTFQSSGHDSDLVLKPVSYIRDPLRGEGNFLVMNEVLNFDLTAHITNSRAQLRNELEKGAFDLDAWFGFEQEYTLFQHGRPYGWPEAGYPAPQGPYYCGVGSDKVFGREIIDAHLNACIEAGIMIYGINAEVMPSQWEFQIGYRGIDSEQADPLTVCDHLWFARYLLQKIAEEHDAVVNFEQKPMEGDWNGAGAHTNFSTAAMRDAKTGWAIIQKIIELFSKHHADHLPDYGFGLEKRLTGKHETCDINTFKAGERNRGASLRISEAVARNKCGYLEDRRPGANIDPYRVAARILNTIMNGSHG